MPNPHTPQSTPNIDRRKNQARNALRSAVQSGTTLNHASEIKDCLQRYANDEMDIPNYFEPILKTNLFKLLVEVLNEITQTAKSYPEAAVLPSPNTSGTSFHPVINTQNGLPTPELTEPDEQKRKDKQSPFDGEQDVHEGEDQAAAESECLTIDAHVSECIHSSSEPT